MKTEIISNQWLLAYYKALKESWENKEFKHKLLHEPEEALKNFCAFLVPSHIELRFVHETTNNFIIYPEFAISVFDEPSPTKVLLQVPLVPPPPKMESELSYLNAFSINHTACCACMCC
jgi:hypothetical protein